MGLTAGRAAKEEPIRVVMLGLDAAGKTTALYRMKAGDVVNTMPTIGVNVEETKYNGIGFTAWDVGGRSGGYKALYRHYYQGASAVIFVVDANDEYRLDEAGEILRSIKHEEYLQGVPLLVVANKQDLPNAISPDELAEKLELADVFGQSRLWRVVPAITTDKADDGWKAGMKWLTDAVKQYKTGLVAQEEEAAAMKKLAAKSASLVNTVATKTAATTTAGATPAIAA